MEDLFKEKLKALRAASLDRRLREISSSQGPEIEIGGRRLVNFSSNDYLVFANDSRLRKAAIAAINEFGLGAGASRLISGTQSPHVRLERALAKWIEWLLNRARSFVYSTAPPPAVAAAALAAVNFLSSSEGEKRRLLLWEKIYLMRKFLLALSGKRSTLNSNSGSAIFPWTVGHEQAALNLASALQREGFLVPAIRYPTVAKGAARLRITVTALHQEDQIHSLCEAIKRNSAAA